MAYADEGAGPPLILVHGWAANAGFFGGLRRHLSRTHRVLTPTLRGHPGSDRGSAPLTIQTLGEDIAHFSRALDLSAFTALGWSMGAMAMWAAAPLLGARLNGLIVEEMGPRLTNDGDWRFGLAGAYERDDVGVTLSEIESDWPAYVARFAPRMFSAATRAAQPDLAAWAAREMSGADASAMASLWTSMAAQDFRTAIAAIAAPVLVIRGAESPIYPDGATDFVARTAPTGIRVIIPGVGHVPHLEAPEAFAEHVETFAHNTRQQTSSRGV
jgi:pimeloyl-[acyl-carrier protein] methyl ester esterase